MDNKASFPLRICLNVLYYSPKQDCIVDNILDIPLTIPSCQTCENRTSVAAIAPATNPDGGLDTSETSSESIRLACEINTGLDDPTGTDQNVVDANNPVDASQDSRQLNLHDCHVENPLA